MTNLERWRLYMRDIESPDIYVNWGFYHMISSALQRRVWMWSDLENLMPCSFSLYPNMYITLVGPPSTGKGRVITQESAIIKSPMLELAGPTGEKSPLIPYSPSKLTVEALTQHISMSVKSATRPHPKEAGKKQTYAYCPCSFMIEELEVLFAQNTNDMVSVLVDCYDSHDLHYKTKHQGEDKIKNVCISMISGTTPDSIRDLMANKVIKKGMTSRTIFVYADKPRFYRQFPGLDSAQMQALSELVTHVKKLTTLMTEVVFDPEAREYHKRFYESGEMSEDRINKDQRLDHYYGRKNVHWLKLAMCMLYSDQTESNILTVDHLKQAYGMLKTTELRMHESFVSSGRNILFESVLDVERHVYEKERVSYKKLWWHFSRDLNKQQFEEVINLLTETGRLKNQGGEFILTQNRLDDIKYETGANTSKGSDTGNSAVG